MPPVTPVPRSRRTASRPLHA